MIVINISSERTHLLTMSEVPASWERGFSAEQTQLLTMSEVGKSHSSFEKILETGKHVLMIGHVFTEECVLVERDFRRNFSDRLLTLSHRSVLYSEILHELPR